MEDPEALLIAEQLKHALDLMQTDIKALQVQATHDREFSAFRLTQLEQTYKDHETRLRSATDGITQFKTWAGLASGGSSILAIIAFVKALFFGG